MKVQQKFGNVTIEVEGDNIKQIMHEFSQALEVYSNDRCGACDGTQVMHIHRSYDSYDFYESVCMAPGCYHVLPYGIHKDDNSGLYAKRNDPDGNPLPNQGWKPPYQRQGSGGNDSGQTQETVTQVEKHEPIAEDDIPF